MRKAKKKKTLKKIKEDLYWKKVNIKNTFLKNDMRLFKIILISLAIIEIILIFIYLKLEGVI